MVVKVINFPVLAFLCYRKRLGAWGVIGFTSIEFEVAFLRKIREQEGVNWMLAVFWVTNF